MKKTNALMLSYIIFLTIALLVKSFFNWNELDRIAMAATIAGYFFALADLFNWTATFNKYYFNKIKILQKNMIDIYSTQIKFIEERQIDFEYMSKKVAPYKGKNSNLDSLIDDISKTIEEDKSIKVDYKQSVATYTKKYNSKKQIKRTKLFEKAELVFVVLGFVSFFLIIVFDYFSYILSTSQSTITVTAFIIIMSNYYIKDIVEENLKTELDKTLKDTKNIKTSFKKTNQQFKEINLPLRVDSFIDMINKAENHEQTLNEETNK